MTRLSLTALGPVLSCGTAAGAAGSGGDFWSCPWGTRMDGRCGRKINKRDHHHHTHHYYHWSRRGSGGYAKGRGREAAAAMMVVAMEMFAI